MTVRLLLILNICPSTINIPQHKNPQVASNLLEKNLPANKNQLNYLNAFCHDKKQFERRKPNKKRPNDLISSLLHSHSKHDHHRH